MNQQQIKTLIDALAASDLSELEYSENGCLLRLFKHAGGAALHGSAESAPVDAGGFGIAAATRADGADVLAPLYGVIHLQRSPGEPPFVQPGEPVAAGQTLCVIEAMKVFNEVVAERDGTLRAVLVASGDEVDAGQPLFRID